MKNDPNGAVGEALPPLHLEKEYPAEARRVKAMKTEDLLVLHDGLSAAVDAMNGIFNQPRCEQAAGDWLENEMERFGVIRGMAIEEACRRPCCGDRSDEDRIGFMVAYDLKDCGAGVLETIAKMGRLYDDLESFKFQQARKARA